MLLILKMNPIFSRWYYDFLFLYAPFLVMLGAYALNLPIEYLFYMVFLVNFIDISHIYTTNIKTTFHRQERSKKYVYIIPLAVFILCLIWGYGFQFNKYYSVMMYAAMLHNIKQGYGVLKWYEKRNNIIHTWTNKFYYCFTLIPIIAFHFKKLTFDTRDYFSNRHYDTFFKITGDRFNFYSFEFDNKYIFFAYAVLILVSICWVVKELIYYLKTKNVEINRILFILFYAIIHVYGLLIINNPIFSYIFVVGIHGIHYLGLMSLRTSKVENKRILKSTLKVFLIGIIGGFLALSLLSFHQWLKIPFFGYLIFSIYSVPVFSHFLWDGFVWKKNHADGIEYYK